MEIVIWVVIELAVCFGIYWLFARRGRSMAAGEPALRATGAREDSREMKELEAQRARALNLPLSELARPASMDEIIGQADGVKALRAALCGANPQHVIIYGPPGVGKTCAARLVLEEAKSRSDSPFDADSAFVEVDATAVRFDERSIADPLIGSVHDPIYQGAGSLGAQGVPQPKPGAVTRAHCGVLFLDEIGELHPSQMNKLLKVLEDRCVHFDSAYYSPDNAAIPAHIHDIFKNGLPADFRLVGATTRAPEELAPALRSRCVELFFKPLGAKELRAIADGAARRLGLEISDGAVERCGEYSSSGRDAVNMVQLAGGAARDAGRATIGEGDVLWVAETCRLAKRPGNTPCMAGPGVSTGLAVTASGEGVTVEVECAVRPARRGEGRLTLGGMVEEEEIDMRGRRLRRKGSARVSAENVCAAFSRCFGIDARDYDVAFNIPGGVPMDGPSAGTALAAALMSAVCGVSSASNTAFTGEVTAAGAVRPVGGVRAKTAAAAEAGALTVVVPAENAAEAVAAPGMTVVAAENIYDVMRVAFPVPVWESMPVIAHGESLKPGA